MIKHSLTPWTVRHDEDNQTGYNYNGETPFLIECAADWTIAALIGDVASIPAEANAQFIVRACNAYDEMLAALIAAEVATAAGSTLDERAKARALIRDVLNKTEAD